MSEPKPTLEPTRLVLHETPHVATLARVVNHAQIWPAQKPAYERFHDQAAASSDGSVRVEYYRPPFGRYYVTDADIMSATPMWSSARAAIYAPTDADIDGVQMFPCLLLHEMETLAARDTLGQAPPFDALTAMVANRDAIFAECWVDPEWLSLYNAANNSYDTAKDVFKRLVNVVTFGGGMHAWIYDMVPCAEAFGAEPETKEQARARAGQWQLKPSQYRLSAKMEAFVQQIPQLAEYITAQDEHAEVAAYVKSRKLAKGKLVESKLPGQILATILQHIEGDLMLRIMQHFSASGLQPKVYCYDGFQVTRPQSDEQQQVLDDALAHVSAFRPHARFIVKPFREPVPNLDAVEPRVIDGSSVPASLTDSFIRRHWRANHAGMSQIAARHFAGRIVCSDTKGVFWKFNDTTGLWVQIDKKLMLKEMRAPIDLVTDWTAAEKKRIAAQAAGEDSAQLSSHVKSAQAFWANSNDTKWKEVVIRELVGDLYDDMFTQKLDMLSRTYSAYNGLVDCATGQLRPRTPADFCSKRSTVVYDPNADSSKLVGWLTDVFTNHEIDDTADIVAFLQLMVGGMVAGLGNDMQLPACFFTGNGGNGKGVLLSIIRKLFDGPTKNQNMSSVLTKAVITGVERFSGANNASPELAKLEGVRLAYIDELDREGTPVNTTFKNIVGSDDNVVTARHLFQNSREFLMNVCLLVACNKMPGIPTTGGDVNSFLRRMLAFPFKNDYKDDSDQVPYNASNPNHRWKDAAKCRSIKANMSGVLLWAVQGAVRLIAQGRLGAVPKTCASRLKQAADDSNWVSKFEFHGGDNKPSAVPRMKIKDIKAYIGQNFGMQVANDLKNSDISEALRSLGCWSKTVSRVDTVFAVRIVGDTAEPNQFM